MLKSLFEKAPEKNIQKAYIQDQAQFLRRWLRIITVLAVTILTLFIYLIDIKTYHTETMIILQTRGIPFLIGIVFGLIAFLNKSPERVSWLLLLWIFELGLLVMSFLLMSTSPIYQIYVSTHILIMAFCFIIHRGKAVILLGFFLVFTIVFSLYFQFSHLPPPTGLPNLYLIALILPPVSHIIERERWKAFHSTFRLNEITSMRSSLLKHILPVYVITDLEEKGESEPRYYENCSIIFTDFVDFTKVTSSYSPKEVLEELDALFSGFDQIMDKYNLQKIKTIGDSYMFAAGLPKQSGDSAKRAILASLEILGVMDNYQRKKAAQGMNSFGIRIGINTGPVVAGMVGEKVFSFDIWGDTVNTASRIESASTNGRICISESCYQMVKKEFKCEYRGEIPAKGKGELPMYYIVSDNKC